MEYWDLDSQAEFGSYQDSGYVERRNHEDGLVRTTVEYGPIQVALITQRGYVLCLLNADQTPRTFATHTQADLCAARLNRKLADGAKLDPTRFQELRTLYGSPARQEEDALFPETAGAW